MTSNKGLEMNDYEQAMRVSSVFYNRYKSLCHGTSRRHELKRLYEDTQPVILQISGDTKSLRFSQILYALSHGHNVLKVLGGNEIQWNVFNKSYNKHKQHPDRLENTGFQSEKRTIDKEEESEEQPLWYNDDLTMDHELNIDQTYLNTDYMKTNEYFMNLFNLPYNYTEPLLPLGQFYTITGEI
jgi:hypothetical protein